MGGKSNIVCKTEVIILIFLMLTAGQTVLVPYDFYPILAGSTNSTVILHVGGNGSHNYTSIQRAIDNATDDTTIMIHPGIYYEHIVVDKKIQLIGTDKATTIINGSNMGTVVSIIHDEVSIKNITMTHSGNGFGSYFFAGVYIQANDTIIHKCSIDSNEYGIIIHSNHGNTISYNEVINNNIGFFCNNAQQNYIYNNVYLYNAIGVQFIQNSDFNKVINNEIKNQIKKGVSIESSTGNELYLNDLNNRNNSFDDGSNRWYNVSLKQGNRWSDYNGSDTNCDGIGDIPYNIPGGTNTDEFPLVTTICDIILVDDDYSNMTSGWNRTHFNSIQDGIHHAKKGGTVSVQPGMYYENIIINTSIRIEGISNKNTTVQGSGIGSVVIIDSPDVTFSGFTIMRSGRSQDDAGIIINKNNIHVENNSIMNCSVGIYANKTSLCYIHNNSLINDGSGMCMVDATRNTIDTNNILRNEHDGILILGESSTNRITQNHIKGNHFGIWIESSSQDNVIFQNVFENNSINAYDAGVNSWDNGYSIGGNHWDDYTGVDGNRDGRGDTPYPIDGGDNQDYYPLVEPKQIYVDDDAEAGWYDRSHVKTIQEGIQHADLGGTIFVMNGTYEEHILINKSVKVMNAPDHAPVIQGFMNQSVMTITSNNVHIEGLTIRYSDRNDSQAAIEVYGNASTFQKNTLTKSKYGLLLQQANDHIIQNNEIRHNTLDGILLLNASTNNHITKNNVTTNQNGITVSYQSHMNTIQSNKIFSNTDTGITIDHHSKYNEISSDNKIFDNAYGIVINDTDEKNTLLNNMIYNNRKNGVTIRSPRRINTERFELFGNTISTNENGLIIDNARITIRDNIITDNNNGMILNRSLFIIDNNEIKRNENTGISIHASPVTYLNVIKHNDITDNHMGIRVDDSDYIDIKENNISSNNLYGLLLRSGSNYNVIYYNNFIENGVHADDDGDNIWDIGHPHGGNYWDDHLLEDKFQGPDQNKKGRDGICDTPYLISENNSDHYPFIEMDGWKERIEIQIQNGLWGFNRLFIVQHGIQFHIINRGTETVHAICDIDVICFPWKRMNIDLENDITLQPGEDIVVKLIPDTLFNISGFHLMRLGLLNITVSINDINWTSSACAIGPFVIFLRTDNSYVSK